MTLRRLEAHKLKHITGVSPREGRKKKKKERQLLYKSRKERRQQTKDRRRKGRSTRIIKMKPLSSSPPSSVLPFERPRRFSSVSGVYPSVLRWSRHVPPACVCTQKRFSFPRKLRAGTRGGVSHDSAEAKNIVTREASDLTCQTQRSCLNQHISKPIRSVRLTFLSLLLLSRSTRRIFYT